MAGLWRDHPAARCSVPEADGEETVVPITTIDVSPGLRYAAFTDMIYRKGDGGDLTENRSSRSEPRQSNVALVVRTGIPQVHAADQGDSGPRGRRLRAHPSDGGDRRHAHRYPPDPWEK
jgi:hypothetical protein